MLDSGIFIRDFGTKLEEIQLKDSGILINFKKRKMQIISFENAPYSLFEELCVVRACTTK